MALLNGSIPAVDYEHSTMRGKLRLAVTKPGRRRRLFEMIKGSPSPTIEVGVQELRNAVSRPESRSHSEAMR